jgi:hypothetical protein
MRVGHYWSVFATIIATPFEHITLVWGIVPLYFGFLLNELASPKANFRTAIQTGFSFLWAGIQWLYPYFVPVASGGFRLELDMSLPVNLMVTFLVLAMGVVALVSGLRKRFPKYGRILGHTRFANYFMISIFPMQAHALPWTWTRLLAVAIFALPVWIALYLGLMPFRSRK